jgi:3-oxoadipate enol-lactonase
MPSISTPLGRWFYEERGDPALREAVVLLHGFLFDHAAWRHQLEAVAPLGRAIAFDQPGHGRSEVPPPFTVPAQADALAGALAELGVRRALVVGHSWGGMVALELALRHPRSVGALALVATSGERETALERAKYAALLACVRRFGRPDWIVLGQLAPLLFGRDALRARPDLVRAFAAGYRALPFEALERGLHAIIGRPRLLERLREVTAPALVVCGREDRCLPPVRSERLARALPGARLHLLDRAGHMCLLEQPDALDGAVVPFLREHLAAEIPRGTALA